MARRNDNSIYMENSYTDSVEDGYDDNEYDYDDEYDADMKIDNSELSYTEKNICIHVGKNNIISRSREYLCRKYPKLMEIHLLILWKRF